MMISHDPRFIFIHVPKVAGTSLKEALRGYIGRRPPETREDGDARPGMSSSDFEEHITASELKEQLPPALFDGYFKFAFVRNPYDWVVSNYFFFLQDEMFNSPAYAFFKQRPFRETVKFFLEAAGNGIIEGMKFSQKAFLYDGQGRLLVDYAGKYERLSEDFAEIRRRLGMGDIPVPYLNKSNHKRFNQYYTPDVQALVYGALKEDFETFGYDYDYR